MKGEKIKVLVVDRPLKSKENPARDIFNIYKEKYDIILFPEREDKSVVGVVFFSNNFLEMLKLIFSVLIKEDKENSLFYFVLDSISEESFMYVLSQRFEIEDFHLTEMENN